MGSNVNTNIYIYRHVYNVIITEMSHCITDTT